MAKTYSVPSTYIEGGTRSSWDSGYWNNMIYTSSRVVNTNGYNPSADSYFSLYIMFNADTLASLRAKTVTDIKLVVTISGFYPSSDNTYAQIGYKYNNARGSATSSSAYARGNANSTSMEQSCVGYVRSSNSSDSTTGSIQLTIPLSGVVPKYGYAIGPSLYNNKQISFGSSATLKVTTNETDYTYTLSYNANGGTGAPANQTGSNTAVSPSYTFTITKSKPTRTGYTFAGWADSASGSVTHTSGSSITLTSTSKTLYAVWTKNSYTVNVKCQDPEGSVSNTAAYFDVWYSDDTTHKTNKTSLTVTKTYGTVLYINNLRPYYDYTQIAGVDSMVSDGNGQYHYTIDQNSANKNLIIRTSRRQYTVSYNANGGTDAPANQTKSGGVNLTLSNEIPTRDGYTFVKWNTASDGSGTDYNPSATYTGNAALTLYAIWVASSSTIILSYQSCEAGQVVDIIINKLSPTATHTLTYTCGNQNGTSVTKTTLSPLSLVSEISEEGGPCYIYCTTYVDDVQTGVPQDAMLVVIVPGTYQPSVTLTVTKVNTNPTVSSWGILLQGYSQVQLTATSTMATGATLVSYNFTGPDVSYLGPNNQVTSNVFTVYGKTPWTVTVTDSRGRTASATWEYDDFEIYPYSSPSIVSAITQRTDSTGVSSTGAFLITKVNYSISSCNNNNAVTVRKVEYKASSDSAWTLGDDTLASNVWTSPYGSGTIDPTVIYNVRYTFTDTLGNTTTQTANISAVVGIGIGLKNDRLRLGGLPTKPGLQVDWDAEFNGTTTFNSVVDVTQRRCSATLSSSGWYRVMQTKDVSGTIIDFRIGRPYGANPAEAHKISFYIVGGGKSAFLDETSDTNTLCVDKIRATYGGGLMYFDVHYNASSANEVLVYFDVYGKGQANGTSIAMGLASVADDPDGETELTTHEFSASVSALKTYVDATASNYTVGSSHYVAVNYPTGINPTNCVGIGLYVFSSVSGPVTFVPYGQIASDTKWYIIGDAGVTLTNVKFRYWYI